MYSLLLKPALAAELLQISRPSLRAMIRRGELKAVYAGHALRIPRAEIDRWLRDQLEPPATEEAGS